MKGGVGSPKAGSGGGGKSEWRGQSLGGPLSRPHPLSSAGFPDAPAPGKAHPLSACMEKAQVSQKCPRKRGRTVCRESSPASSVRPSRGGRRAGGPVVSAPSPTAVASKIAAFPFCQSVFEGPSVWRAHGQVESHWAHRAPPSTSPQGISAELWREAVRPLPLLCPLTPHLARLSGAAPYRWHPGRPPLPRARLRGSSSHLPSPAHTDPG